MLRLRFPIILLALVLVPQGIAYGQDRQARGWVDVNIGAAASGAGASTSTLVTPRSQELQTTAATYGKPSTGADFDFGGGYMITPRFGLGVSVSGTAHTGTVNLRATVPSPFLFNDLVTATSTRPDELIRTEGAMNIHMVFAPVNSERSFIRLFAGPTFFRYSADMVKAVRFTGSASNVRGSNRITITGFDPGTGEGSGWGFHAGADASFFFSRIVGVGAFGRYSRGTVGVDDPLSSPLTPSIPNQIQDIKVGGLQAGGGLRLRF